MKTVRQLHEWYKPGDRIEVDPEANRTGPKDPHPRRGHQGTITKTSSRTYNGVLNHNLGSVHVKFDKDGREEEIDKRHLISIHEEGEAYAYNRDGTKIEWKVTHHEYEPWKKQVLSYGATLHPHPKHPFVEAKKGRRLMGVFNHEAKKGWHHPIGLDESHGAFADWARENKANKAKDNAADKAKQAAHRAAISARKKQERTIRTHHNHLIKNVYKAEHHLKQDEWEDAVAAVADHQRKYPHLKLPGHLGEETQVHAPHTYLDTPHLVRLNTILTQITGKLFLSLQTYVDAVRAALDFHGIKLPHLDCEQEPAGPNAGRAYGDLIHGPGFEINRNVPTIPNEFEYVFELKYEDITGEKEPQEFLYMCANQVQLDNEGNFWETYAQVVNAEELDELLSLEEDPRKFPDLSGDASGETEYLKLQRHTNTSGTSPEEDHE